MAGKPEGRLKARGLIGVVVELAPAQNVKVKMGHRLAAVSAHIADHPVAGCIHAFAMSHRAAHRCQVAEEVVVGVLERVERSDVASRNHQNVSGCLGIDVADGKGALVLMHEGGRDVSG